MKEITNKINTEKTKEIIGLIFTTNAGDDESY